MMESTLFENLSRVDLGSASGKTWQEPLLQIKAETFAESCERFYNAGRLTLDGGCWTAGISESPNPAVESSLSQILEADVAEKYYVTPRQAAYALRRAKTMGWKLPEEKLTELQRLATHLGNADLSKS